MTEFQIDIFVLRTVFVSSGSRLFFVVDYEIQEMFFIFTMRSIILEFNRQIFIILVDSHISCVDLVISDFFFVVVIFTHRDDVFS